MQKIVVLFCSIRNGKTFLFYKCTLRNKYKKNEKNVWMPRASLAVRRLKSTVNQ